MNEIHHDLHESLQRHADDVHGTPLSLDSVRARARRIRRNRRLAVAGGVAAVLLVAVPTAMVATNGPSGHDSPLPATRGTDGPPTKAADPRPEASGPAVAYARGTALVLPGGSTEELPRSYSRIVVSGDEVLGLFNDDDTGAWQADILDLGGSVLDTVDITQNVAVSADGTTTAWVTPDGDVVERTDATNRTLATDVGQADVQAVVDGGVYVNRFGVEGGAQLVTDGGVTDVPGSPVKVTDATSDGLVAMQTRTNSDASACSGVYDTTAGRLAYGEDCEHSLFRFSPDGRHVSASDAYLDADLTSVMIMDARTGEEVARYAPEGGVISHMVWEDSEHLLMSTHDAGGWSITRLALDGSTESLVGPSPVNDALSPGYVLAGSR